MIFLSSVFVAKSISKSLLMKFFYTRRKPQSCTLVKPSAHRWVNPRLSALGTTQLLFRCTGFTGLTELITNFDQLWFSRRCKLCCLLSKLWGTTEVALKIIHSVYTSKLCNAFEWCTVEYSTSYLYFLVYTQAFRRVCTPRKYKWRVRYSAVIPREWVA